MKGPVHGPCESPSKVPAEFRREALALAKGSDQPLSFIHPDLLSQETRPHKLPLVLH